jgi:hypothetical protein
VPNVGEFPLAVWSNVLVLDRKLGESELSRPPPEVLAV